MYPGCRFMDLHPQERGQLSYAPHHGPGFGHVPSPMKMDTSRSPVNYESFPCSGSYGCPYPLPYQGCYHNQSPPDYHGYGLHYPHYAPLPPVYCYGSYPPLPGSYPFQYLPSPYYSAADPRYEYDKKGPLDHHCCGCPNHSCQQKENKNVKIEEQTSDDEKDKVASLVPSELKDQYPVLWIPPGYKRNEGEQTIKPESKRESSSDKEAKGSLKPYAQEPGVRNGWLPINLNNLVQGRNKKGTEHEDSESFFPVVGMPRNPEQKDKLELKEGDQKSIWDPSQYRIFPLKCIENQDEKSMPEGDTVNYENSSSEDGPKAGDKIFVKKIIPVKQIDRSEEKGLPKDDQTKENRAQKVEKNHSEMPLKHADKKGEKKHLENNSSVQSSLSKASKLPPVCLRVDPLPRRRTKGDSSRSPSLPANKKKSEMLSHDKSSSSTMQGNNQQESSADSDSGGLQRGKEVKDIEVVDSTMRDNKIEAQKEDLSQSHVNASAGDSQEKVSSGCQDGKGVKSDLSAVGGVKSVDKLSGEITKDEAQSGDVNCETGANGGPIDIKKSGLASTNRALNQKFSEAEAAVIIQSVYRGFEVRRWEPLKKLKEIARIEAELVKVRLDVQNLVSSGNGNIDKKKIVIGETIMNLLLQLDTMQGLHPSIRNIRKSVAKELVSLQEKLDSITSQSSEELKEPDVSKHAGEISNTASEEERQKGGEDRHEQDTTSPSHMKSGATELCQDQSHTLEDANISSVDIEKSELMSGTDEMGRAFEEKQPDFSAYVDLNGRHLEPLVDVKEPSEVHGVREDRDSFLVESKELPPSGIAEEKLNPVVQLQNLSSLVDSDWSSKEDEVAKVNTEVPPGVPEQNSNAQVCGEGLQIDGGRCIVEPGKVELVHESGQISARETSAEEQEHTKLLAESLKLSDPEDNIATSVCSEGSSELKDNVSAEGDLERDKELSGDDMLRTEFVEASNGKHVNNIKGEANVCAVEGDDKSIDDMWTAAVGVDTKGIPDMKEVANACELEGEGDDKPVDDMHTADSVGVETKETLDMKEAVNVCEVEGEYKPADDRQTADTVGLEHRETPEVNEFLKDVGPVEDVESIETCGPELEDLSKAVEGLFAEEPRKEVPASLPVLGQISSGTGKESDKELVEENEKLKETVEKLIAAGKEQLNAISSLSERVKDLEKKLSRKKKLKMRRHKSPSQYLLQV